MRCLICSVLTICAVLFLFCSGLSAETTATGSLEATLTWHYNDVIGSKGDVGAVVLLFSEPARHKLTEDDVERVKPEIIPWEYSSNGASTQQSLSFSIRRKLRNIGIFAGEANGNGSIEISDVPPGKYILLALSNNANDIKAEAISDDDREILMPMFASASAFKSFEINATVPTQPIASFKPFVDEIIVHANVVTRETHDFGTTSI